MLSNAGKIKVNTDEVALDVPSLAAGGCVFCTSCGFVKGCLAIPLGNRLAFEAELLAVAFALETIQRFSWDHLWLVCDSMYLVQLLSSRSLNVPWFIRACCALCLNFIFSYFFFVFLIFLGRRI